MINLTYRRCGNFHGRNISWTKFSRDSIFMGGCSMKFWTQCKFLLVKNFTCAKWPKQSRSSSRVCVRGYHKYKDIWEVAVGETVVCMLEPCNFHDRNAVTVEKDGRIIGHLSQKVSHHVPMLFFWDRWNHSLYCDWKTVGKTARQAKVDWLLVKIYHNTSFQFFVALIIH